MDYNLNTYKLAQLKPIWKMTMKWHQWNRGNKKTEKKKTKNPLQFFLKFLQLTPLKGLVVHVVSLVTYPALFYGKNLLVVFIACLM